MGIFKDCGEAMIKYIRYLVYKYDQKNRRQIWEENQLIIQAQALEEMKWVRYPKLLSGISLDTGEVVYDYKGWKSAYEATEKRIENLRDKVFAEMPEYLKTKSFKEWRQSCH